MNAILQAAFDASLLTASHSVFYRLPSGNTVHGMCSEHLHPAAAEHSGFIVQPFSTHEEGEVIIPEITFSSATHGFIDTITENDFTERYRAMLLHCGAHASDLRCTPFYNPNTDIDTTREMYLESVEKALNGIRNGAVEKLVCSRIMRHRQNTKEHITALFTRICESYPDAFVVLLSSPYYGTWLGASPELLLEQKGDTFHTISLAGTVDNASGDAFTEKEQKEQHYITRFVTESLPEECTRVTVSDTRPVNTGLLTHLKTEIDFQAPAALRPRILNALHPTPAVCGYPKQEAQSMLETVEVHNRHLYSGYWGILNGDHARLFVNIRCMQYQENTMVLYAGAGITDASNAEKEWQETGHKLKVLSNLL